jgi:large subunit ribosomal protein L24
MTKDFSPFWKSSKNRSKQRKYVLNAPAHIKRRFLSAQLSKTLKQKYKINSFMVKKGDKVKVMRGQFKTQMGAIDSVDVKNSKVKLETIFTSRRDGTKAFIPIHASNVQLQELNLEDRKRKAKIESFSKKEERKVNKK